ncbi:MAG: hypothetical protein PHR35_23515, partial [Kiritimatiellae bacterium]|nr:hypothetical protein [Kiritimatiellia bacterium]
MRNRVANWAGALNLGGWLVLIGTALLLLAGVVLVCRCHVELDGPAPESMSTYEERLLRQGQWPKEVCEVCGEAGDDLYWECRVCAGGHGTNGADAVADWDEEDWGDVEPEGSAQDGPWGVLGVGVRAIQSVMATRTAPPRLIAARACMQSRPGKP